MRSFLHQDRPCFLMQVHDGISTKVAQHSGFKALWASSFGCTTALGVRDDDSLGVDDTLTYLQPILRCSHIPVLVDGNCGFGSVERTQRFVRSLAELGAAGVCLEDKQYPKANTFYSPFHPLIEERQYCELIRLARQACSSGDDLCIVARTEALVIGEEVHSVIRRCEEYYNAGAEGIFVSWISPDVRALSTFVHEWNRRAPLLINPTAYVRCLSSLLSGGGVSSVIWANHNIRACVKAMSLVCDVLLKFAAADTELAATLDSRLSSMKEIFELVGYAKKE